MDTSAVTLALLASFLCCLPTKSSAPPRHAAYPAANRCSGVLVPGLPGPPMAFGTDRSAFTVPSAASVCPLRPPVAVAVAVKSGLIASIGVSRLASSLRAPLYREPAGAVDASCRLPWTRDGAMTVGAPDRPMPPWKPRVPECWPSLPLRPHPGALLNPLRVRRLGRTRRKARIAQQAPALAQRVVHVLEHHQAGRDLRRRKAAAGELRHQLVEHGAQV